jgi:hypothetical protein
MDRIWREELALAVAVPVAFGKDCDVAWK